MTQSTPSIPQLQTGPKQKPFVDLMRPGDGTPWENRGDVGAANGLFGTCIRVITKPGVLLDHIRNTNVPGDANSFVWMCGVLWGLGVITHRIARFFVVTRDPLLDVDTQWYWIETLLLTLITIPWVFFMHRMIGSIFYKLVATEFRTPVPKVLVTNVIAYCLGVSLLAVIPFYIGPGLAVIFLLIAMTSAGVKRLYITWHGALIDAILAVVSAIAMTMALALVLHIVWNTSWFLDNGSIREKVVPPPPPTMNQ